MSALAERMAAGAATVCRAWVLTRRDGRVFGFTDHDGPLEVEGVTCAAASGLTAGSPEGATGLAVDNVEVSGALSHDAITEADLRAGRWDGAEVAVWLVDWAEPGHRVPTFRGTLGEVTWGAGAFAAELRGLAEPLNRMRGRVFQAGCDAVLGDARCGVDLGDARFSVEALVAEVAGAVVTVPALPEFAEGWFGRGRLEVLDGAAEGLGEQVRTDRAVAAGRELALWAPLRAALAPGDRVRVVAGCDRRAETCREKFGNFLNFRGFPQIPGEDWLMRVPSGSDVNDGGRL
jgi:uncharacterized phage protein (TIGR02218 family)